MTSLLALALTLFVAPAPESAEDALKLATKLTTEGSANFDKKDAKALAESYTEDATVTLMSKDKETGLPKLDVKRGRGEIQELYQGLFKDAGPIHSRNDVEHAKLVGDFLIINGVFDPDLGYSFKIAFTQIRFKQNDRWLILSMELMIQEEK